MNLAQPQLDLSCQEISPKKLAWIMDVGESTVADWLRDKEIDHFKKGRVIRMSPEAVLAFMVSYTVRGKGRKTFMGTAGTPSLPPDQMEVLWGRINRLIDLEIQRKLELHGHLEAA